MQKANEHETFPFYSHRTLAHYDRSRRTRTEVPGIYKRLNKNRVGYVIYASISGEFRYLGTFPTLQAAQEVLASHRSHGRPRKKEKV